MEGEDVELVVHFYLVIFEYFLNVDKLSLVLSMVLCMILMNR